MAVNEQPTEARWQPDAKLAGAILGGAFAIGVGFLLVAVTGGPVKILGSELPDVHKARGVRIGLGITGGLLVAAVLVVATVVVVAWWRRERQVGDAGDSPSAPVVPPPVVRPRLSPWFVGRKQLLVRVSRELVAGRPAVLVGLSGVGKTQLALTHIKQQRSTYSLVAWLRAEQITTLASDYASLAVRLKLPEGGRAEQSKAISAVREWLAGNPGWLLVFDNAIPTVPIDPYLPEEPMGRVLVTSQNPGWDGSMVVRVDPWSREESLEFLEQVEPPDAAAADELAAALGDLPLALEQARAYMGKTHTSMADYLGLWQDRQRAMLTEGDPIGHEQRVATTWSLALDQLDREEPAARELLWLCAFLAPEAIPRTMLTEHAEALPEGLRGTVSDRLAYNRAVAAVEAYSLLGLTATTLEVHRLVQQVIRHSLDEPTERYWVSAATRLLRASFPRQSDDVRSWAACQTLLSHALVVADHAQRLEIELGEVSWLLDRAATYLEGRGQFGQAKSLFERALAIAEAAFGPNDTRVAAKSTNLGNVLRALGDLEGARVQHERALPITEAALGPNHPHVAVCCNNLGAALYAVGELSAARTQFERALAIAEATLAPTTPMSPPSATASALLCATWGIWRTPVRSSSVLWRSMKSPSARIIPRSPSAAVTSVSSCAAWGIWRAPASNRSVP